jgi:hypothetical protein
MQTVEHQRHITSYVSHNDCQECRADCERQFLRPQWPGYRHVTEYLSCVKPRLEAIRQGETSVNARIWHRDFVKTLHRRITLKSGSEHGRKRCDGYLSRLRQFSRDTDAGYLRRFARRGASTLQLI